MSDLLWIDAFTVAPTPWKNGGGSTRELLAWTPDVHSEGDWALRVSLADIDRPGPFSSFDGIERHFAVLSGAGVLLRWADGRSLRMSPADPPLTFNGSDAPDCDLLDGTTTDLNVMARKAAGSVDLHVALAGSEWIWSGAGRGVFTRRDAILDGAGPVSHFLMANSLLWCSGDRARKLSTWSLQPLPRSGEPASRPDDIGPLGYWIGFTPNFATTTAHDSP